MVANDRTSTRRSTAPVQQGLPDARPRHQGAQIGHLPTYQTLVTERTASNETDRAKGQDPIRSHARHLDQAYSFQAKNRQIRQGLCHLRRHGLLGGKSTISMRPGGMHQGTTRRMLGNQSAGRSSAHLLAMQRMHPQKAFQSVKRTLSVERLEA